MLMGQKLGSYSLEKELGSGAMGTVYRARNDKTGARVAIKVLAFGLGKNEKARARFEREVEVLKQLDHPNIVRYVNHGRFQGTPYIAMEFVDGETLDSVMQRRGRFTWEEVVEVGRQICAALQHAHHAGIIHRDLKPSNLMVTRDGVIKLADFGIAKDLDEGPLTSAHCTVGTAAYMSPEQCKGEKQLTHRSDLYSLGVVLYELLTGQKPFTAETPMEMFVQHTQGEVERPARLVLETPVWLDNLICQLLAKKPDERGFDAAAVGESLGRVMEKVSAQESAGVAAAKTRIMDPARDRTRIEDVRDKKTARTLLTAAHGRRRRRGKPVYQKVWFQATACITGLIVLGLVLYFVFRPASDEQLYQEAKTLIESNDPNDRTRAREGPLEKYLARHTEPTDEIGRQMHRWADEIDRENLVRGWTNRMRINMTPDDDERLFRDATRAENAGELARALDYWTGLEQLPAELPRQAKVRRQYAADRKKEIHSALALEEGLRNLGPRDKPRSDGERVALLALRYEAFGDVAYAHQRWRELGHVAPGSWALVGAKRAKDLRPPLPAEALKARLTLLQNKLKEAQEYVERDPQKARVACEEIRQLYGQDHDGAVRELVKKAEVLLGKLPTS